jgi:hypothetical protein
MRVFAPTVVEIIAGGDASCAIHFDVVHLP